MTEKPEDEESAFLRIYDRGGWWGLGSGPGTSPRYNRPFLDFLTDFITSAHIRSIVDYGCGDWTMFSKYEFGEVDYLGIDVVKSVVEKNRQRYARRRVEFRSALPLSQETCSADLLLMKDVLLHLPNGQCADFLDYARSRFRFGIFVNGMRSHEAEVNEEIEIGGYRPVDIAKPPFALPARTVLVYGTDFRRVFDGSSVRSLLFGRRVQSGRKHVQLVDFQSIH
jgi:hypothetical protein